MNVEGLHLSAHYRIDLDQYKQARFLEGEQTQIIIDQLSRKLADEITHKQNFFSSEIITENNITPYKLVKADCYVLTENEFFRLVESIRLDIMRYYPIGYVDIVDNRNK